MDSDELIYDLYNECSSITVASVHFDEEYFTLSYANYELIRIKNRYVVMCHIPDTDWDKRAHCCTSITDILQFLSREAEEFQRVEGASFSLTMDIESEIKKTDDSFDCACKKLDSFFEENIAGRNTHIVQTRNLLRPSEILFSLASGQEMRPAKPNGFVIDENDHVYIREGSIWFGPIGGDKRYFSDELGIALDCLGIKWSSQKFLLSHKDFNQLQSIANPTQFLHMFQTSKQLLKKHRAMMELDRLTAQKQDLEQQIMKVKQQLNDDES